MFRSEPARIARRIRWAILGAVVVVSATTLSLPTAPGETDGAVPDGARVFDDDIPAVANLDPRLLRLCRIYRNEPWHYELRREAIHDGCPPMYADPRHNLRTQQ
jgi:hypothetical protein